MTNEGGIGGRRDGGYVGGPGVAHGPRFGVEAELARLWAPLVGDEVRSVHDDFFELGGDSLDAVRLVVQIRKSFGYHLDLTAVFEHRTIASMALLLRGPANVDNDPLVTISADGDLQPLHCIGPLGGSPARYFPLPRYITPSRPILALQPPGIRSGRTPDSVEQLADIYSERLLREGAPHTVNLLGYSYGGTVAYEIAQRLHSHHISCRLIMVDTVSNYGYGVAEIDALEAITLSALRLPFDRSAFVELSTTEAVEQTLRHAKSLGLLSQSDLPLLREVYEVTVRSCRAAYAYEPLPYPGEMLLIRGAEAHALGQDLGWNNLANGVKLHSVDANHYEILEPIFMKMWCPVISDFLRTDCDPHR